MYVNANQTPRAYPVATAFANATRYYGSARGYRPLGPRLAGRSMASLCAKAGLGAGATRFALNRAYAAHKAGQPLHWPA